MIVWLTEARRLAIGITALVMFATLGMLSALSVIPISTWALCAAASLVAYALSLVEPRAPTPRPTRRTLLH